ncbi:MAG TPA: hypothetical protein VK892_06635 [Pyrinomonadaceae bacterium]|nr:hypothetical protein [Pyrinomonadaceae bacterium]
MDIFESELPNIRIRNIGTILSPLEIVEARIVLEAWDGYFLKHRENGKEITDGKVLLYFNCYRGNNAEDCRAEINAYNHLLKNQYEIRDNILKSLTEEVNKFTQYLDPDDSFVPNITPETKDDFDFKPFIGPLSVSFHEESKNDIAYLEWHFQCVWDPEHGFAVTTHQERVIHIDQDTDIWKIYEDKGRLEQELKEYEERMKNFKPKEVKPWWKFW